VLLRHTFKDKLRHVDGGGAQWCVYALLRAARTHSEALPERRRASQLELNLDWQWLGGYRRQDDWRRTG